jgi:hypothetical protein
MSAAFVGSVIGPRLPEVELQNAKCYQFAKKQTSTIHFLASDIVINALSASLMQIKNRKLLVTFRNLILMFLKTSVELK